MGFFSNWALDLRLRITSRAGLGVSDATLTAYCIESLFHRMCSSLPSTQRLSAGEVLKAPRQRRNA